MHRVTFDLPKRGRVKIPALDLAKVFAIGESVTMYAYARRQVLDDAVPDKYLVEVLEDGDWVEVDQSLVIGHAAVRETFYDAVIEAEA